jgi:seryl-tRNA synthetase
VNNIKRKYLGMSTYKNITEKAEREGWIISFPMEGQWVFTSNMTRLLRYISETIAKRIAQRMGFEEWIFPRVIPEDALIKTGWLQFHNDQVFQLVSEPDTPYFGVRHILDPIQCVSLYHAFSNKILEQELPIRIFERIGGWTWRNEPKEEVDGLYKSIGFLRLEMVWFADKEKTTEIRNRIISLSLTEFWEEFRLKIHFSKGESCFEESSDTNLHEKYLVIDDKELYNSGTVDLVYREDPKNDWMELASGSISVNKKTKITKSFNIRSNMTRNLCSGCFGFGLTRIALAFLLTNGFDKSLWPRNLRKLF